MRIDLTQAGKCGSRNGVARRRAAALILCIFTMLIVSSLVVLVLEVETTEMAIMRNTLDLSRALYAADAGVQHALAMLRADRSWRSGFPSPGVTKRSKSTRPGLTRSSARRIWSWRQSIRSFGN